MLITQFSEDELIKGRIGQKPGKLTVVTGKNNQKEKKIRKKRKN
jgi:hypothetical protein